MGRGCCSQGAPGGLGTPCPGGSTWGAPCPGGWGGRGHPARELGELGCALVGSLESLGAPCPHELRGHRAHEHLAHGFRELGCALLVSLGSWGHPAHELGELGCTPLANSGSSGASCMWARGAQGCPACMPGDTLPFPAGLGDPNARCLGARGHYPLPAGLGNVCTPCLGAWGTWVRPACKLGELRGTLPSSLGMPCPACMHG